MKPKIKTTKKAGKVLKEIDKFIDYYAKAKNKSPDSITISGIQKETLGIDTPYFYRGIKLVDLA